jgi:hypothetical protein
MLDAFTTADVQALRLSLHDFASRQSDQVVQICCCAVDLDLARILGRQDDQMVRELAASVERLAKAVQTARTADQGEDPTQSPRDPVPFEQSHEQSRVRWFSVDLQNFSRPTPRAELHLWKKSNA